MYKKKVINELNVADFNTKQEIISIMNKQEKGFPLNWANEELKDDNDVVETAVKYQGIALEFASDRLKNDFNIVMLAVKQDPYALVFASDELKDNDKIVQAALNNTFKPDYFCESEIEWFRSEPVINFASSRLRKILKKDFK